MKRHLFFTLLFLVALSGLRADGPVTSLDRRGPEVELGKLDEQWQALFTRLSSQGAVYSRFTEHRWFPFKKIPVVLEGELRLAPAHGLSLRYTAPDDRTMVVDEKGLLLRDGHGRTREIPPDPRAGNVNAALLPVLKFDREELLKVFLVYAAREGSQWRLDFVPRSEDLSKTVGQITVWGKDALVTQLEFRRSGSQRVEIFIHESQVGVTFSADDLKRFFR